LWIEQNQLGRRNLTDSQRAVIALSVQRRRSEIARRERAKAGGHAKHGTACLSVNASDKQTDTRASVAREACIPERKLRQAAAIERAKPALLGEVRAGGRCYAPASAA
jgi:hypothetical protein